VKLVHLVSFIIKKIAAPFASVSVTCVSYRLVFFNVGAINHGLYQVKHTSS
jgi:hypothetical protein